MSNWALIIYCGLITYLTRFSMIALIKKEMFNDRIRQVLSYVPSAIFPAIIFPAIFLESSGSILIEDKRPILVSDHETKYMEDLDYLLRKKRIYKSTIFKVAKK